MMLRREGTYMGGHVLIAEKVNCCCFLVACTRLYKSLYKSRLVRWSVGPSVGRSHCWFFNVLMSFSEFSKVFKSFQKFSQVFTSFHKFSQVFTSFHKFKF